jgi:hypothetical protein
MNKFSNSNISKVVAIIIHVTNQGQKLEIFPLKRKPGFDGTESKLPFKIFSTLLYVMKMSLRY